MADDWKTLEEDDLADGADGEGARSFVTDTVRKAFLAGVGALFMTEEGARRLAREWKLPKEVLGFVTSQASGAKDEVLRIMTEEIRRFFQSEALRREFVKLIGSMSLEVHAEIRLKDVATGKVAPRVHRATVRTRSRKEAEPAPEAEPAAGGPPAAHEE
jgi:hypothetical protein